MTSKTISVALSTLEAFLQGFSHSFLVKLICTCRFICEKTGSQPKNFNLMAGMPPKYITTDESVTLENAELEGAVIIQRPA